MTKISSVRIPARSVVIPGQEKPKYKIPSLRDIRKIKARHTVISMFAGSGGSSLGYRMAGFKVLLANEFVKSASETYSKNKARSTIVNTKDIRELTGKEILESVGKAVGEVDVLDGSPPCTCFSTAGIREKGWGKKSSYYGKSQRTDDLFYDFIRILSEVQPKVFVAENVVGLVTGVSKGIFKDVLKQFKLKGYRVKACEVNAAYLGVPQKRKRIIFIGVRDDINKLPVFPVPLKYTYSLRESLVDVNPYIETGAWIDYSKNKSILAIREMGQGTWLSTSAQIRRAHFEQPVNTITAHATKKDRTIYHPLEHRLFSISELKRIFSFPDDFVLTGSYPQQGERLGLSVPPMMMFHIANTISKNILC